MHTRRMPVERHRTYSVALATAVVFCAAVWLLVVAACVYAPWQFGNIWTPNDWHGSARLPFLGEAVQRFAAGVGGAALLMLAAVAFGGLIIHIVKWTFGTVVEWLCFSIALGVGGYSMIGLACATIGLYRPIVLWLVVIFGLLAGMAILHPWRLVRPREVFKTLWLSQPNTSRIWLLVALGAAGFACLAALTPEREFDAVWYHLAYPQRYLAAGRLVDLPDDYVSLYPMTFELWFGYGLAIGGPVAAKLLHFAMLPLVGLLCAQLCQRFAPKASPALAAALFITTPLVLWEASTAYVDLALTLFIGLGLYAALCYSEERKPQWLIAAALNIGLALAIKHLALVALGLICAGLLLKLLIEHRRFWPAVRDSLALGFGSLVLPLPWYVRSFMASGNPVFPELFEVFGAPPQRWDAVSEQGLQQFFDHFGPPRTLGSMLLLPWDMATHPFRYDGSLGPLFLLLAPLAIGALWASQRGAVRWLAGFVVLYMMFWASPFSSFQMRFLIPIVPILAVLAAAGWAEFSTVTASLRRLPAIAGIVLAVFMMLNWPIFTPLQERDRHEWSNWLNSTLRDVPLDVVVGADSQDAFLKRSIASYGAWQFAEQHLPVNARVLAWSNGDDFYTHLNRVCINAASMRPIAWATAGNEEVVWQQLHAKGITHLIVDRRANGGISHWNDYAITSDTLRARYAILYEDQNYTVFSLDSTAMQRIPLTPSDDGVTPGGISVAQ